MFIHFRNRNGLFLLFGFALFLSFIFYFYNLSSNSSGLIFFLNDNCETSSHRSGTFQSTIKRESLLKNYGIQDLLKSKRKSTDPPCDIPMMGVVTMKNGYLGLREITNIMDLIVVSVADPEEFKFDVTDLEPLVYPVEFLSLEKQKTLYPKLSNLLPSNHFARKNIGYLHALRKGACQVYDFDQDIYLTINTQKLFTDVLKKKPANAGSFFLTSKDKFVNPLLFYGPPDYIWPRGFPLELVQKKEFPILQKSNFGEIDVIQIVQSSYPDVDSNWRVAYSHLLPMGWHVTDSIIPELIKIDPNRWSPFNAQSTVLSGRIARFAMLPHTVPERVSDIWRSYIMQYLMKLFSVPGVLSYSGLYVENSINRNSIMSDKKEEIQLDEQIMSLVDHLDQRLNLIVRTIKLGKEIDLKEEYISLIDDLYRRGFIEKQDVEFAILWILAVPFEDHSIYINTHHQPLPAIHLDEPVLNITVVLHINFGRTSVVPIWMGIYGHRFREVRVYSALAMLNCAPISGIRVHCISKDIDGIFSYESTLHTISSLIDLTFIWNIAPFDTSYGNYNIDKFQNEGVLFLHDDMFIKKSEISDLGGQESYEMTDVAYTIATGYEWRWAWLGPERYYQTVGEAAMARLRERILNPDIRFYWGQSDGYYVARKDMVKFAQYGYQALSSNLFLEIAIPTLFNYFIESPKTKFTYTKFDEYRWVPKHNVDLVCREVNMKMLHPVKLSLVEAVHASFIC